MTRPPLPQLLGARLATIAGRTLEHQVLALETALQLGLVLVCHPHGFALCDGAGTPYAVALSLPLLGARLLLRQGRPDPDPAAGFDIEPAVRVLVAQDDPDVGGQEDHELRLPTAPQGDPEP